MFSKETYLGRRNELKKRMKKGLLLFLGNIENPINFEANAYPFRQDSTFLYYFGIQEPKLAAIIDVEEDKTILFGDELNMDEIVWRGRRETIAAKAQKSGVSEVQPYAKVFTYLEKAIKRKVHYLPPYQSANRILLHELTGEKVTALNPSVEFIKAVVAQRSIKEQGEIDEIEKAVNRTNEMHRLAMKMTQSGLKEYEVINAMQKFGADAEMTFAYSPIFTINGQILHNTYKNNTLKSGDLVLNDAGLETVEGYAADITRTFPVSGTFDSQQREIYEVVYQAFNESAKIMKPGVNFKEVHRKSAERITKGLQELGLMKGTLEESVEANAFTLFFQCGVGHMMGLDVHDMEDLGEEYVGYTEENPKDSITFGWKSLRLGKPLQEGHVVTVEPGIYFIPELIEIWKKENRLSRFINYDKVMDYLDFGGIRIEDNFLITQKGNRLLGQGLPSSRQEIEDCKKE